MCLVLMQVFSCLLLSQCYRVVSNTVHSYAYIQVHFRHDVFIEANNMNPNQIDPFLIWGHIVCNISYQRTKADETADGKSPNWRGGI